MGVILALKGVPQTLVAGLDWTFWFQIAIVLFLASIFFALISRGGE